MKGRVFLSFAIAFVACAFLSFVISKFTPGWVYSDILLVLGGDLLNIARLVKHVPAFFQQGVLFEAVFHDLLLKSYAMFFAKLGVLSLFVFLLLEEYKRRNTHYVHVRGSRFVSVEELRKLLKGEQSRLKLGPLPFPTRYERQGIFLLGAAGSGKTVTLKHLLNQILKLKHPVIIYDRKPDYTLEFYDEAKDLLFFPRDKRSLPWNLFAEVDEESLSLDIDFIASVLIPPASDPREQFWRDAAYHILRVVLLKVWESQNRTMKHFVSYMRFLMTLSAEEMLEELEEVADKYGVGIRRYLSGKNMTTSVLATLEAYLQPLVLPELCHEGSFSIREFVRKQEPRRIYVVNTIRDEARYRSYYRCFIELAIREFLSLQENPKRRFFFVLDEFQSLGKMEALETGIVEGRSKGFSPLIATQSLAQVEEMYGMERMRSIFQSCGTKIIHRYEEPEGAKFISDWLGEEEVKERKYTYSEGGKRSHRWEKTLRKVLLPSELNQLREGEAVVKIGKFPPTRLKIPYQEFPQKSSWKFRKGLPECAYRDAYRDEKKKRGENEGAHGNEDELEQQLRELL